MKRRINKLIDFQVVLVFFDELIKLFVPMNFSISLFHIFMDGWHLLIRVAPSERTNRRIEHFSAKMQKYINVSSSKPIQRLDKKKIKRKTQASKQNIIVNNTL